MKVNDTPLPPKKIFFAIVEFLPINNNREKKKSIVKTYKPFQNPRILLVTLLLFTTCNAYN